MADSLPDPITTSLAIWGAVTGTAAVGWNVFRDVRDRARLEVHCFLGYLLKDEIAPTGRTGDGILRLIWKVTNVGRRPLVLNHVGATTPKGSPDGDFLVKPKGWPKMLEPGEYQAGHTSEWPGFIARIDRLFATDTLGRVYKAPRKDMEQIRADAEAIVNQAKR